MTITFMIVKAVEETITSALNPNIEKVDIIKSPVTLPAAVIRARVAPNSRLCVDTSNIAGPGIAAAISAIEQKANQFSKFMIFPIKG